MFHDHATEEWDQKAGLYLTGRASAKEFLEGVRARVGDDAWRPFLEPHVLRLFFRAKKNGLPDVYHKVHARSCPRARVQLARTWCRTLTCLVSVERISCFTLTALAGNG